MRLPSVLILLLSLSCSNSPDRQVSNSVPDHSSYSDLLARYVVEDRVNYKALQQDSGKLNDYLKELSTNAPAENWSKNEKLAYWINAYNAFTLKLIIDHYPIRSITELHPTIHIPLVSTVWHREFFEIGGKPTSLDEIEHKILRKQFDEPRIHFAINCASISCPPLRNEAYLSSRLEDQLDEQSRIFINDPIRNNIKANHISISKIFSWFSEDFTQSGGLIDFLNQYSEIEIDENATVDYLKYDWKLNDLRQR